MAQASQLEGMCAFLSKHMCNSALSWPQTPHLLSEDRTLFACHTVEDVSWLVPNLSGFANCMSTCVCVCAWQLRIEELNISKTPALVSALPPVPLHIQQCILSTRWVAVYTSHCL